METEPRLRIILPQGYKPKPNTSVYMSGKWLATPTFVERYSKPQAITLAEFKKILRYPKCP